MRYIVQIQPNEEQLTPDTDEIANAILDGLAAQDFLPLPPRPEVVEVDERQAFAMREALRSLRVSVNADTDYAADERREHAENISRVIALL